MSRYRNDSDWDYPKTSGDTLTEEQKRYYRRLSYDNPDKNELQLREDLCKFLGICLSAFGAAAVGAVIANYVNTGGTRKRSTRGSTRSRRSTRGSTRRNKRSSRRRR